MRENEYYPCSPFQVSFLPACLLFSTSFHLFSHWPTPHSFSLWTWLSKAQEGWKIQRRAKRITLSDISHFTEGIRISFEFYFWLSGFISFWAILLVVFQIGPFESFGHQISTLQNFRNYATRSLFSKLLILNSNPQFFRYFKIAPKFWKVSNIVPFSQFLF